MVGVSLCALTGKSSARIKYRLSYLEVWFDKWCHFLESAGCRQLRSSVLAAFQTEGASQEDRGRLMKIS